MPKLLTKVAQEIKEDKEYIEKTTKIIDDIKRAPNGRFLKGKAPGPGRPSKHQYFQNQWDKIVGKKEFEKVVYALIKKCLQGDTKAIAYFLDRCLGKIALPVEFNQMPLVDLTQNDSELKRLTESFSLN
jgi:hypothetical protein